MTRQLGSFVIPDDSGIIAVLDASRYRSFVRESWTLEEILGRFRDSMADQCLLVWATGAEGNWRVRAQAGSSDVNAVRSAAGSIQVAGEGLHVVSYDSLTMAAQYADEAVPQPHERESLIPLAPGSYRCLIHQLFDPSSERIEEAGEAEIPHFILDFAPTSGALEPWRDVMWLQL